MKSKMFIASLCLLATTSAFAQKFVMGDILRKDELIIINKLIVCSAYALAVGESDSSKIVYGDYTTALQIDKSFTITGRLAGDLISIDGDLERGAVSLSMQESKNVPAGQIGSYSTSTSGYFTNDYKGVRLTFTINGMTKSIGCTLRDKAYEPESEKAVIENAGVENATAK